VILSRAEIKPHRSEYWVMTDFDQPYFEQRCSEVCGLYLDPPENALGLWINEKTSIQAKGLARPDSQPAPGKPARRDYELTRNGTMSLFAALRVHTGETHAMTSTTRNSQDLIPFLGEVDDTIAPAAGREIVAIMDNLSTHKSKETKAWLKTDPHWRFVHTPNHASWLKPGQVPIRDPLPPTAQARPLRQPPRSRRADARLHRDAQPDNATVSLDLDRQGRPQRISQQTYRTDHST
jgi:hypothetical protein